MKMNVENADVRRQMKPKSKLISSTFDFIPFLIHFTHDLLSKSL